MFRGKIVIVGSGDVGSTTAYTIMLGGLFSEIVIIDQNNAKAEGDALDISHGVAHTKPVSVYAGNYKDCKDCDIVVITAGANQNPGENRIDLLKRNAVIVKSITGNIGYSIRNMDYRIGTFICYQYSVTNDKKVALRAAFIPIFQPRGMLKCMRCHCRY